MMSLEKISGKAQSGDEPSQENCLLIGSHTEEQVSQDLIGKPVGAADASVVPAKPARSRHCEGSSFA
jgi:hypothetical protein